MAAYNQRIGVQASVAAGERGSERVPYLGSRPFDRAGQNRFERLEKALGEDAGALAKLADHRPFRGAVAVTSTTAEEVLATISIPAGGLGWPIAGYDSSDDD